jgi:predicted nucleic acid-binding protein
VLAYPEFGLDSAQQATLFARYQALALKADVVGVDVGLPRCSDPDDQQFIELAAAIRAQCLVSKDRALLKLHRRCAPQFRILTPAEAVRWLGGSAA